MDSCDAFLHSVQALVLASENSSEDLRDPTEPVESHSTASGTDDETAFPFEGGGGGIDPGKKLALGEHPVSLGEKVPFPQKKKLGSKRAGNCS